MREKRKSDKTNPAWVLLLIFVFLLMGVTDINFVPWWLN